MVELQGSLEIQHTNNASATQAAIHNLTLGALCRTSTSTYKLVIGYHEIEGTKVTLKKPLVILKKVKKNSDDMELDNSVATGGDSVEMQIVGIIRHKLLFKSRPKALISKQEVKPKKQRTLPDPLAPTLPTL